MQMDHLQPKRRAAAAGGRMERAMKRLIGGVLAAALLLGAGCSFLGLFGPKGPQTVTFFFSNETIGELKPCG